MRPHNAKSPLDLRKFPICYLCGVWWMLVAEMKMKYVGKRGGLKNWRIVVQCGQCLLTTYAYADEAVLHSRNWRKCR